MRAGGAYRLFWPPGARGRRLPLRAFKPASARRTWRGALRRLGRLVRVRRRLGRLVRLEKLYEEMRKHAREGEAEAVGGA